MNRQDAKDAKTRQGSEPDSWLDEVARIVIGAAISVHSELGPGFLESVYEEALAVELQARGVSFEKQAPVDVFYRGVVVGLARIDFLVERALIVELKSCDAFAPIHVAQVVSYLRATGCRLGLLLNFNVPLLRAGIRRVVSTR